MTYLFGLLPTIPRCLMDLRLSFPKRIALTHVVRFMRFLILILNLIRILWTMSKKDVLKVVLTVVKYGITLVLGFLGGSSPEVSQLLGM